MAQSLDAGRGQAAEELASLRRRLQSQVGGILLSGKASHRAVLGFVKLSAPVVCLSPTLVPHAQGRLVRGWNLSGKWVRPHRPAVFPVGVKRSCWVWAPSPGLQASITTARVRSHPAALRSGPPRQVAERCQPLPVTG